MNLELHKEFYFFEWQRRDQLQQATGLPVAILTVLIGGLFLLVQGFNFDGTHVVQAFVVLVICSVVAVIWSSVFLAMSLQSFWYAQVPRPERLQAYWDELSEYHSSVGNPDSEVTSEFDETLKRRLAEATSKNRTNNIKVAEHLHKSLSGIVVALFFVALSTVPYLWQLIVSPTNGGL